MLSLLRVVKDFDVEQLANVKRLVDFFMNTEASFVAQIFYVGLSVTRVQI